MNKLALSGYRFNGNLNEGVGDAIPGGQKAGTITGAPSEGAFGQLGNTVYLSQADALAYTNPNGTIPTLYAGFYTYVQMLAGAVAAVAAGQLCFYDTLAHFVAGIVTTDVTATTIGRTAGVILSTNWTKGNYWWIYSGGGLSYVKSAAAVTSAVDGNLATVTATPAPTVDGLADATAVTDAVAKSVVGVWAEAPANGALKRILMNTRSFPN
jgi:hypothetical protein